MNKKGQFSAELGLIIIVAITLVVGVVLFQVIAQEVGKSTNTVALENQSLGVLVNGTDTYVTNCRAISGVQIWNATNDVEIPADNFTIVNNQIHPTTGSLTVVIEPNVTPLPPHHFNEGAATIDATCQPLTYIADTGGRAMANIIVIFFALAVAVVALTPSLRSGVLNALDK